MPSGRRFAFRPVLTVFSVLALALLLGLGNWQLHRLQWKRALIASVEAKRDAAPIPLDEALARAAAGEDVEYLPVRAEGRFLAGAAAPVFGTYDGAVGAFLFAPLLRADGTTVYVNRGFTPQDAMTDAAPPPTGEASVAGLLRRAETVSPPASWFRPAGEGADGMWFIRDPQAMAAAAGAPGAIAYYIDQYAVPGGDWPKGGTTRVDFRNKHLEYALTWFGLAAALVGVWGAASFQRRR